MADPVVPVTSTTAPVVHVPHYPPIRSFPRLPPTGGVSPGPDVKTLMPAAGELLRAAALSKVEGSPSGVPSATPGDNPPSRWSPADLFSAWSASADPAKAYPPADPFTVYLMATLSRFSYGYGGDGGLAAKEAIDNILEPKAFVVVKHPSDPYVRYAVWTLQSGAAIYAFPGTYNVQDFTWYSLGMPAPAGYWPTDWRVYHGVSNKVPPYASLVRAAGTGIDVNGPPVVMTGHSMGGALAQILGGDVNNTYLMGRTTELENYPVRAWWTFGAPAWLYKGWSTPRATTLAAGVRVVIAGDPIPYATQAEVAARNGFTALDGAVAFMIRRATNMTEHFSKKTVVYEPERAPEKSLLERLAFTSLVVGGTQLALRLSERHSIRAYCTVAAAKCKPTARVAAQLIDQLNAANAGMDNEDWKA